MRYNYKDTGIEWLGKIPEHWKFDRVKDVSQLRDEKINIKSENKNYLELEDIEQGSGKILGFRNTLEVASAVMKFKKGDVLFGKLRPYLEKYYYADEDGLCTGEILAIQPKKVHGQFLKFFVGSPNFIAQCNVFSYGTKMPRVNWNTQIAVFKIPFPPLPEQRAIADYLDKACKRVDKIIEIKQKQLEKIEGHFITRIIEATTKGLRKDVNLKPVKSVWIKGVPEHWKVKKIKRLTKVFRGKFTHRPRNDERLYDGDYPFIQTGSVTNAKKYINDYHQTLNKWGKSVSELFPAGTLTMTIAANIADVAILNFDACFPDSIVGFKPQHFIEIEYLYYLFIALRQDFLGTAIITTQMNLNVVRIGDIEGFAPPKDEQLEIVEYLNNLSTKTENLKENINDQITTLQTYRKSLIHECVTGKKQVWEGENDGVFL